MTTHKYNTAHTSHHESRKLSKTAA